MVSKHQEDTISLKAFKLEQYELNNVLYAYTNVCVSLVQLFSQ